MPPIGVPFVCDAKVYKKHYGHGLDRAFVGSVVQEGSGLGGLISSLVRRAIPIVLPVLKKTAKSAGKTLVKRGSNVLKDVVLEKKNLKQSLKRHATEGLSDILEDITKQQSGQGRRLCRKKNNANKRRRVNKDIFD